MNIIKANIVDLYKSGKIVCITTNGFIKKNGQGVLGRGNALAMAQLIPQLPTFLADHIKKNGNIVGPIFKNIISFPVKPVSGNYNQALNKVKYLYVANSTIPGYHCKASLELIEKSLNQLNELIENHNLKEVYLPLPGCSNGELKFEEVKSILEKGSNKIIYCSL